MPNFSVRTVAFAVENRTWLGSAHGTEATQSATLDIAGFTAGTHYPNGYIPSGVLISQDPTSKKWHPWVAGEFAGHLFNSEKVDTGQTVAATAVLLHGQVIQANLPAGNGVTGPSKTALAGQFIYR